jgi:hypothetical protein
MLRAVDLTRETGLAIVAVGDSDSVLLRDQSEDVARADLEADVAPVALLLIDTLDHGTPCVDAGWIG